MDGETDEQNGDYMLLPLGSIIKLKYMMEIINNNKVDS